MNEPLALVPARMVNEFLYCPRLAYLEWVQGEWAPNVFTEDGSYAHRRVDRETGGPTALDEPSERREARGLLLTSEALGLVARADLVEFEGTRALPVDTKRGAAPKLDEGAYEPERAQVCAQSLILRDLGYEVPYGEIYFVASKKRVRVELTPELEQRTLAAAASLRELAAREDAPPPLVDDPKCNGCSLAAICLPDEVNLLRGPGAEEAPPPRPVRPPRADALPLYVQEPGSKLGVRGDRLVITHQGKQLGSARLEHTSHVAVFGGVQVSTQAMRRLLQTDRPLALLGAGGWFHGLAYGQGKAPSLATRRAQFRRADDPTFCLSLATRLVTAKIANQRTLLRRNAADEIKPELERLQRLRARAPKAANLGTLLGIEGNAARIYWEVFPRLLKGEREFMPAGRNRRPPRDPVNALISFLSALLAKDCALACALAGLDPSLGFYHQPRPGKPSLALDLMEEFRPLIADSVVLSLINTAEVTPKDFLVRGAFGTALTSSGRKKVLGAYERRLAQQVTHPVFGYRISYRQTLAVQARLLGRYLTGEIPTFPEFLTR